MMSSWFCGLTVGTELYWVVFVLLGFTHTSVVSYESAKWLLGLFGFQMGYGKGTRPCVSHRVGCFKSAYMTDFPGSKRQTRNMQSLLRPRLELAYHSLLLLNMDQKTSQFSSDWRGGEINSTSRWEGLHSHISKGLRCKKVWRMWPLLQPATHSPALNHSSTTTMALSSREHQPPLLLTRTPTTSLTSGIYRFHRVFLQSSITVLLLINFLFVCERALSLSRVWLSGTTWTVANQAPLSRDLPGKNTRVGCCALLQGIFLTQGLNPHVLCLLY